MFPLLVLGEGFQVNAWKGGMEGLCTSWGQEHESTHLVCWLASFLIAGCVPSAFV